jgi:exopolysaccharide biosynthesis polyprenyl glycosylphosphotransferase
MSTSTPAAQRAIDPRSIGAASDARAESAVSASTYAVPAGFLWLADLAMQSGALLLGWRLLPLTQWLSSAERAGRLPWLSLPPASMAAGQPTFGEIAWIPLVMVPVTLLFVHLLGGYRPLLKQSRTRVVLTSVVAPLVGVSLVTLVLFTVHSQSTSRALIFSLTLLSSAGLFVCRYTIRTYKYRRLLAGHYTRNVVIVAPKPARQWLSRHFAGTVSQNLYRLYGYLEIPGGSPVNTEEDRSSGDDTGELVRLGSVDDLGERLVHRPIHEVVVVQAAGSESWLKGIVEQCEYFRVTLRLVPEALLSWQSSDLHVLFGDGPLRLPEIVLRPRHLDDTALFVKRLFDIIVSATLLLLLSPGFLLIAIAVKLTTPALPVLYPWRVIGYKGRPFTGYKFTTMQRDAEDRKADLMHLNEMSGPVFKIKDDPRITPLGRILRRFSLNELPQLWSVLKGDMSLVGPRPAGPHELARYELWHKRKLCVQPGITCLWQIRGRNKINKFDDWVRMDFEYIDNWSLWLDFKILIRTAWTVVAGTGS